MKCVVALCFLIVCILTPASCDCATDCMTVLDHAMKDQTDMSKICSAIDAYFSCFHNNCKMDVQPFIAPIKQLLKPAGVNCSIPGSSTVLAGSLVTVLVGLMVAMRTLFNN